MQEIETIGERIRRLRKARGISQHELGKVIETSQSQIVKYETIGKFPNVDKTAKMARALGVSFEYLVSGDMPNDEVVSNVLYNTSFAMYIKSGMSAKGLSVSQLAEATGISQLRLETLLMSPTLEEIKRLSAILEISMNELIFNGK